MPALAQTVTTSNRQCWQTCTRSCPAVSIAHLQPEGFVGDSLRVMRPRDQLHAAVATMVCCCAASCMVDIAHRYLFDFLSLGLVHGLLLPAIGSLLGRHGCACVATTPWLSHSGSSRQPHEAAHKRLPEGVYIFPGRPQMPGSRQTEPWRRLHSFGLIWVH